jgi:hypothetical protein
MDAFRLYMIVGGMPRAALYDTLIISTESVSFKQIAKKNLHAYMIFAYIIGY